MGDSLNSARSVAALIDHTLLKPEAVEADVKRLCGEARTYEFASVCINPCWVSFARDLLDDSAVRVCTVIGFPLGAEKKKTKLFAAEKALEDGAVELDMVLNVGWLRGGDSKAVADEIASLAGIAHSGDAILKVILETCLLNSEQKLRACKIAVEANADFVKTSTGFSSGGATMEDVRLMREAVGDKIGVKASGGIRSLESLQQMVSAGASRIGTSSGVRIIEEHGAGSRSAQAVGTGREKPARNAQIENY
jgi:deoxyribose-phosphate aldolase